MSGRAYLALYFDAPLQSWGYASKFDRRTTLAHPTRSGVIGLLCAASGVDRTDTKGLQCLNDKLEIDVYTFAQGGRLTDYHTVGGGYDNKGRNSRKICRKASGGTGTTVQTWREYLEDARFGAVVSGDADRINALAAHVQNPVWGIWLGRKACIPAARVFEGVHADRDAAVAALGAAAGGQPVTRVVRQAASFEDGTDTLMDTPLDFSTESRRFAPRRICVSTE
jgi:CRISPR system Cascade subunit CasD